MSLTKKKEKESKEEEEESKAEPIMLDLSALTSQEPKIRVTGIYGDINEEKCSEPLYSLYLLNESKKEVTVSIDEETGDAHEEEIIHPIDFIISTHGDSATEMFALYDTMRSIRDDCPIRTYGV